MYRRLAPASVLAVALVSCRFQACAERAGGVSAPSKSAEPSRAPSEEGGWGVKPVTSSGSRSPLATNLDGLHDFSVEWSFVDAFKRSRAWISGSENVWSDDKTLQLDEYGWVRALSPGQIARTVMFWADRLPYPSGDYVVLYEGRGTLRYFHNDKVVASTPGRDVLRVDSKKGGISIQIMAVDPNDYIRNIRVIMPGGSCENDAFRYCESNAQCRESACVPFEKNHARQIFHPAFLNTLRSYSAIRFMTWMFANEAKQREWADRPRIDDASWTTQGAPVEVMVELANRLGVDPWFTLPHEASDDYMRHFAEAVRERLSPHLRAYIEHSNEAWNAVFPQATYFRDRGLALGVSKEPFEAQLRYYSRRSVQMFGIWEKVFGGHERLVRVMASQASNAWVSETVLDFENAMEPTDALAIAPYFGGSLGEPPNRERVANMNLDQLIAELEGPALEESARWIRDQAKVARSRQVALVAYEGGQHLAGVGPTVDDARINVLFDGANRDPRMKRIYLQYLHNWKAAGGQLFAHFVNTSGPSKWGRWGALEWLDQPTRDAPKFAALEDFIAQNPRWW